MLLNKGRNIMLSDNQKVLIQFANQYNKIPNTISGEWITWVSKRGRRSIDHTRHISNVLIDKGGILL